ncbi:MAG: ROK family protein [Candidatus Aminicenantes bacterium]|nr:ROK family protein [Candidatus Aminicenantes bacterium]
MSLYAGFDLGGTHLKYGLVDERGKISLKEKVSSPPEIEDLLGRIKDLWQDKLKKQQGHIRAVGFGFPGIFDLKEKKTYQSPNYPSLDNYDLVQALSRFIDVPFWVNNDANMAAFGEFKAGSGQGVQSLVLLTIGTGVGSGIILEGKLWQGKCGYAGELGHIIVNPEGEKCNCGGQGCLETEVSAPKIVKNYMALKKKEMNISAEEIFNLAKKGDEEARQAFAQASFYLGIGLATTLNLLNPEKILLGGGVMSAQEYLLPGALAEAKRRTYQASFECCFIEKASLGNDAGVIGSALWAAEQMNVDHLLL